MADAEVVWADTSSVGEADLAALSAEERARGARFGRRADRRAWLAARAFLRRELAARIGASPSSIEFVAGEHGRPELQGGPPGLSFNLAHSGDLVIVAISDRWTVGVDVEERRPVGNLLDVAERVLRPEVTRALAAAPAEDREALFFGAWVRHEARLKCRGTGIVEPADDDGETDDLTLLDLPVGDRHAAAVAVGSAGASVDLLDRQRRVTVP